MLRALATGFFARKAAQRLSGTIRNPMMRNALITGATLLGPALLSRGLAGRKSSRHLSTRRSGGFGGLGRIFGR